MGRSCRLWQRRIFFLATCSTKELIVRQRVNLREIPFHDQISFGEHVHFLLPPVLFCYVVCMDFSPGVAPLLRNAE